MSSKWTTTAVTALLLLIVLLSALGKFGFVQELEDATTIKNTNEEDLQVQTVTAESTGFNKRNILSYKASVAELEERKKALQTEVTQLKDTLRQKYRGNTIVTDNKILFQDYEPNPRHAIVTMIGSSSYLHAYWMGAIAMIQSLRDVQTRVPNIVVMVRTMEAIPEFALSAFHRLDAQLVPIHLLPVHEMGVQIPGTWEGAFDKLNVWSLDYDKVLFLDADTQIVQNVDHLLNLPELTAPYTPANCQCNREYKNAAEYFTLSSGFFVCAPNQDMFKKMVDLASHQSPDPADLEQFNGTWHWGDQEMLRVVFTQLSKTWNFLEWEYDMPVGTCGCSQRRSRPVYSYHFVCTYPVSKPWQEPFRALYVPPSAGNNDYKDDCVVAIFHMWLRLFAKGIHDYKAEEFAYEFEFYEKSEKQLPGGKAPKPAPQQNREHNPVLWN